MSLTIMARLSVVVVLLLPVGVFAQTAAPEDVLVRYAKYPLERVFLYTDRDEYLAGGRIQFKAYVICRGQLSKISTNVYVELLNKNKKPLATIKALVIGGVAEGYVQVPASLPEDVYYIRAYTNWMLNFDDLFQFIRPVNIYNNRSDKKLAPAAATWDISLAPEGGNWMGNTITRVAVRLHTNTGLPAQVHGYLFEGKDTANKLADIRFYNNEIGSLVFSPVPGKTYQVMVTDEAGRRQTIPVPAIAEQGIVLKIKAGPQSVRYQLQVKGTGRSLKGYKIVADYQGLLLYSGVIQAVKETVEGQIPVDDKTNGIVQVAVFDPQGELVAVRLCYAGERQPANPPELITTARSDQAKGHNVITLNSSDTLYKHTYLVTVASNETPGSRARQNLLTAFCFADFPAVPERADQYADAGEPLASEALDYLLISEKRGLYDWAYLLTHPTPAPLHFPDNYITYKAKITLDKKPVVNEPATVLMTTKDSVNIVRQVKTDDFGEFTINRLFYRDRVKAYFHIHKKTRYDDFYEISFKEIWDTAGYTLPLPATAYELHATRDAAADARVAQYEQALSAFDLSGAQEAKLLQEVTVQAVRNRTKELNNELSTPLFSDPSEIVLDFVHDDQDLGGTPLLEYLNGRLPGFTALPGETPEFRGRPVILYLDEMTADIDMISTLPTENIAMVKFLRNAFALGASNGVLSIYTKRGKLFRNEQPGNKPARYTSLTGYQQADQFKRVDYSQPGSDKTIRDTRSVLLWKPVLSRDLKALEFYNNDKPNSLRLIFTGLDATGRPFYMNKAL